MKIRLNRNHFELAGIFLLILVVFGSICGCLYSIFAGIWGFNPTDIQLFNLKLFASCFAVLLIGTSIVSSIDY